MTNKVHALDMSHYQTVSSWEKIAQEGIIGILHKATEGTSYVDPTYAKRMVDAQKAGLCWGAYHFMRPGDQAEQMAWFVAQAKLPRGSRMALDYEDEDLTLDDLKAAIGALEDIDETAEICIYSGHLLKEQVGTAKGFGWLKPHSLWLAQYTSGVPSWPTQIWPQYSLWQFTDTGQIDGIDGYVDFNTFNGSDENCAKWFGPVAAGPSPVPVEVVRIAIEVPDNVELRITVNGEEIE